MPLILITGISTSGKSTIAQELKKRGYEAYDTEYSGISAWYNKQTGERAAEFGEMPERTESWLDKHEWRISIDWIKARAEDAGGKDVFVCGGGANEPEVRAVCDKVIWLQTNEETIRERVNYQRDHDYGTKPHELTAIIDSSKQKEVEYRAANAIMVDATQPIEMVVETVLAKVQQ